MSSLLRMVGELASVYAKATANVARSLRVNDDPLMQGGTTVFAFPGPVLSSFLPRSLQRDALSIDGMRQKNAWLRRSKVFSLLIIARSLSFLTDPIECTADYSNLCRAFYFV